MLSFSKKHFEDFSYLNLVAVDCRAATDHAKRNLGAASSLAITNLIAVGSSATIRRKIRDLTR